MSQDTTELVQRTSQRHRVLKQGKIYVASNLSIINCTVRDLSEGGAKLSCGEPTSIPKSFRLVITGETTQREARVRWRRGNDVGVEFVGEPTSAPLRKY